MTDAYPDNTTRRFITASVMAATVMNSLDSTIANVALPHMRGSVSASPDQITWVLTSYIVAAAIMTRSEEHTSELQSLMRISYAVFCLKKKTKQTIHTAHNTSHTREQQ